MGKEKELTKYKADLFEDLKEAEYLAGMLESNTLKAVLETVGLGLSVALPARETPVPAAGIRQVPGHNTSGVESGLLSRTLLKCGRYGVLSVFRGRAVSRSQRLKIFLNLFFCTHLQAIRPSTATAFSQPA
jgi:hypothetical protein